MRNKKRLLLTLCVAGALLAGSWYFIRNSAGDSSEEVPRPQDTSTNSEPKASVLEATLGKTGTQAFTLTLDNNAVVAGESTIRVRESQGVAITFKGGQNQEEAELEIEGLDLFTSIEKNTEVTMEFKSLKKGSFPIKLKAGHSESETPHMADKNIGMIIVE